MNYRKKVRLGDVLVKKGIIDENQLQTALSRQREQGKMLGEMVIALGYANQKDINEALPGMLLIECIYLVVAQIIIFIAVPNKIMCAVGLLVGVIYAVFSSFHLSFTIRKVVYGGHKQSSTLVFGYIVRFLVMIILLALLYIFKAGDLLCAIIGMFSEKIAAYLSPLLDKNRSAKGENSTGEFPQTDKNIIEKESE